MRLTRRLAPMYKKTILAGFVLAAVATLSLPMAANATTYVPTPTCAVTPSTVSAGGSSTMSSVAGTFGPLEQVRYHIQGAGMAHTSVVGSTSTGSSTFAVSLPSHASGPYQVVATGLTTGDVCTTTITVDPTDPGSPLANTGGVGPTDPGSKLADTGSIVSASLAYIGGGIAFIGAALLVAVGAVRRRRSEA
jgi:hypothetical protein